MGFSFSGMTAMWGKIKIDVQTFKPEEHNLHMTISVPIADSLLQFYITSHISWSGKINTSFRVLFEQATEESRINAVIRREQQEEYDNNEENDDA